MRFADRTWLPLFVVFVLLFSLTGCADLLVRPGPTQTLEEVIELEGAERVDVQIRPFAGELSLEGGAEALFEGDFTYNLAELEPQVDYRVNDGVGELEVALRDDEFNRLPVGNVISDWDLRLNEEVPLALDLNLGLGEADADLSALNLTELTVNAGAGDVTVDVGRQDLEELRFNAGLGTVDLNLGGGGIDEIDFDAGAGDVSIDLSGAWESDVDANIDGGLGTIDLILPADVGVRVEVDQGLGDVSVGDLTEMEENVYVNDLFGESNVTLEIVVEQAAGDVNLRTAQ